MAESITLELPEPLVKKVKEIAALNRQGIEEILNNFGTLTEGKQHYAAYCTIKFYQEVKQEIEKI